MFYFKSSNSFANFQTTYGLRKKIEDCGPFNVSTIIFYHLQEVPITLPSFSWICSTTNGPIFQFAPIRHYNEKVDEPLQSAITKEGAVSRGYVLAWKRAAIKHHQLSKIQTYQRSQHRPVAVAWLDLTLALYIRQGNQHRPVTIAWLDRK